MKILNIQSAIAWENPKANRKYFEQLMINNIEEIDLIILPEMFSTGFTMSPENIAEEMDGETISWMAAIAKKIDAAITGSIVIIENGKYYNRLIFAFPSGEIRHYDKRHLFSLSGEDKIYTPGQDKLIVDYKGWKICLLICYDLRFPVFSRNVEDYDLLVYVANWPKLRIQAWDTLLKARAIENLCYVIGVNRIGEDQNDLEYIGHSQVVDFSGNCIIGPNSEAGCFMANLRHAPMLEYRQKFGFLNDRDDFTVR